MRTPVETRDSNIVSLASPIPIPPFDAPEGVMLVHVFSAMPGDTILVQVPVQGGYKCILVDAGWHDPDFFTQYFTRFNAPNDQPLSLDYIIITHPHVDHYKHVMDFVTMHSHPGTEIWLPHFKTATRHDDAFSAVVRQLQGTGRRLRHAFDIPGGGARDAVASAGTVPSTIIKIGTDFEVEYLGPGLKYLEALFNRNHYNPNNSS